MLMKKIVLLAAFIACCTLGTFAQNAGGYVISHLETYDKAKFELALNKCRFDNYRKYDERVAMQFEDGSVIELLSVKEMQLIGLACDTKIVTPNVHQQQNLFALHPDGYITESVSRSIDANGLKIKLVEDAKKGNK
jgi:hypothetical protein